MTFSALPSPVRMLSALVLVAGASAAQVRLSAFLSPAFETPPVPGASQGEAVVDYNPATGMITYSVSVTGFTGTIAHIHTGAVGVSGGILVGLVGGPTVWSGTAAFPGGSVAALLHEGLYVNVHSGAFPAGHVRGQLITDRNFFGALSPANETPPVPSAASGTADIVLNSLARTLTYDVRVTGMTASIAHIHDGDAGVAGPIVFGLTQVAPNHFAGTTPALTDAQLLDMLSLGWYVNVHSAAFPNGEVRDQVRAGGINGNGDSVPLSAGGTIKHRLKADPASAFSLYFVLGSTSGSTPGFPIPGMKNLPLNPDGYFTFTLTSPNTPPLAGSLGLLNGASEGAMNFAIPAGASPALAGITGTHAMVALDGMLAVRFVSGPKSILLVP